MHCSVKTKPQFSLASLWLPFMYITSVVKVKFIALVILTVDYIFSSYKDGLIIKLKGST